MRVYAALIFATVMALTPVLARDPNGLYDPGSETSRWYRSLMQPDQYDENGKNVYSCCGDADAYYCDGLHTRSDGKSVCTITDERPDAPHDRRHIPPGTEIVIPPEKLMNAEQIHHMNPTGHGVVFLRWDNWVFCYVMETGT